MWPQLQRLLGTVLLPGESAVELVARLTGFDLLHCPVCREGTLRVVGYLAPGTPAPEIRDTS